jgi:hypothetical protein
MTFLRFLSVNLGFLKLLSGKWRRWFVEVDSIKFRDLSSVPNNNNLILI